MKKFPSYIQADAKDCGPTCLKIVSKYYGRTINIQQLRDYSETTREGSNLLFLSDAADRVGFRTLGVKLDLESLKEAPLPCVLHWNKEHYVVLYDIKKGQFRISDPGFGLIEYNENEFLKFWIGNNADDKTQEGVALLFETTPKFFETDFDKEEKKALGFGILYQYLWKYKSFLVQLSIGLLAGTLLQLVFPFLNQSLVDIGIQNQNMGFVYLILFAQIFFICRENRNRTHTKLDSTTFIYKN